MMAERAVRNWADAFSRADCGPGRGQVGGNACGFRAGGVMPRASGSLLHGTTASQGGRSR